MRLTKNFNSQEFDLVEGDGTGINMSLRFVKKLQILRDETNKLARKLGYQSEVKLIVNSGYRKKGNHSKGLAVDLKAESSRIRYLILKSALKLKFNRIGIYDKHIHIDEVIGKDVNVVWWGVSK